MANFTVDPLPYTPPSLFLEAGGPHCCARRSVFVSGSVAKQHEDCVIAVVNEDLTLAQRHDLMHAISQYVVQELQLQVRFFALHPHGNGIFRLRNSCQRDALLALSPLFIGPSQVTFYPHDEAPLNLRKCSFVRKCWILLLGYPLDLKDLAIITQVCAPFARVLHWNSDDPSFSRVLLKVLVEDPLEIPRSLVIKTGREADGWGISLTVLVYVFNSTMVSGEAADEEDPLANNGNPHPFHGPVVTGEQEFIVHIADQFMKNLPQ
jgi:hypothetical protein